MENKRLQELAGLITEGKKWSGDVKAKVEVPEGTFTKKAGAIVKTMLKLHGGDRGAAMKALTFFMNRAGDKLENKEELDKAKAKLKSMEESIDSANNFRRIAGLPLLEKKMPDEEIDAIDDESGEAPKGKKGEEDEESLPSIVTKIAKKAEGKKAEELEKLIMKVYDAGFKDGQNEGEGKKAKGALKGDEEQEIEESINEAFDKVEQEEQDPKAKACIKKAKEEVKKVRKSKKEKKEADVMEAVKDNGKTPSVNEVKKNCVSIHGTQGAASSEAKKLNSEASKTDKSSKKYDVAHVVHSAPADMFKEEYSIDQVSAVKKAMVSAHATQAEAKAEAKRLNDEAKSANKNDKKYDVAHVVHAVPASLFKESFDLEKMSDGEICAAFKKYSNAKDSSAGDQATRSRIAAELKKRGIRADIFKAH